MRGKDWRAIERQEPRRGGNRIGFDSTRPCRLYRRPLRAHVEMATLASLEKAEDRSVSLAEALHSYADWAILPIGRVLRWTSRPASAYSALTITRSCGRALP